MNQELTPEDEAIFTALAVLGGDAPPMRLAPPLGLVEPAEPATEALARLYHETLGLVSFGLTPIPPRPAVKRRLMAAIATADAGQPAAAEPAMGVLSSPDRGAGSPRTTAGIDDPVPAPLPFLRPGTTSSPSADRHPAASSSIAGASVGSFGSPGPLESAGPPGPLEAHELPARPEPLESLEPLQPLQSPASPSGAVVAAAASFPALPVVAAAMSPRRARRGLPVGLQRLAAVLLLALAGACGWLYQGWSERGETVARLAAERDAARSQAADLASRLAGMTTEVRSMRDNVAVVTSPAVEACSLQPMVPDLAGAHGILFVAADHQHWYMSLRGLRPPAAGKVYQLWFIGDRGPESGGTFTAGSGAAWQLGAEHMPLGTKEVRITLESGSGSVQPQGPEAFRNAAFRVL